MQRREYPCYSLSILCKKFIFSIPIDTILYQHLQNRLFKVVPSSSRLGAWSKNNINFLIFTPHLLFYVFRFTLSTQETLTDYLVMHW